jgi:hypothetical protein
MKIILNLLGILIYFLNRYSKRRGKEKAFSLKFWITDNWTELTIVLLVDISVMILFITNDLSIDLAEIVPGWLVKPGDLTISWVLGLGLASLIYGLIRRKIIDSTP